MVGPSDVPPPQLPLYMRDGYAVFELRQPASDNDPRTRDWLDRQTVRPRTLEIYQWALRNHLLPYFGRRLD